MHARTLAAAALAAVFAVGCAVRQPATLTRTAHYDPSGRLTGYTVEETVALPANVRPWGSRAELDHFETGSSASKRPANWPPRSRRTSKAPR